MKKFISIILALMVVISSITSVLLTSASAESNLWTSVSASDYVEPPSNAHANFDGFADGVVTVNAVNYQQFGLKMPKLEANADYKLSFGYKMGSSSDSIMLVRILSMAEYEAFCASGTGYLNITNYGKNRQVLGKTYSSTSTAGTFVNMGEYSLNTGDSTDFVLFFQIDGYNTANKFYLNGFNLVENASYSISVEGGDALVNGNPVSKVSAGTTVTVTATPDPDEAFEKWEIVSGDITLADKTAFTTSFTMPENGVEIKAIYKEN